jgi:hypothetical protein
VRSSKTAHGRWRRALAACALAALLGGCGLPPESPDATDVTQLVVLGDSVGAGYGVATAERFGDLLYRNNDALYPRFVGYDLERRYPGAQYLNLAELGATTESLFKQAMQIPPNTTGRTLVLISVGFNDFRSDVFDFFDSIKVWAKANAVVADTHRVLDVLRDRERFPGGVSVGLLDLIDPTDGRGILPALKLYAPFCILFRVAKVVVFWPLFDERLHDFAAEHGLTALQLHDLFLGHGFYFWDIAGPTFRPADPTLWIGDDCLHANPRGNHEIRRLIWNSMVRRPEEELR